jgi:MYXO-CTERM domain-containing protein
LSGTTVDSREGPGGELPGEPFFYTYFPDMSCDPGANCANYADPDQICTDCAARGLPCNSGPECCWGNHFNVNQGQVVMQANQWYALETMVLANTPGTADGEMALWVDGTLVARHTGILWRETPGLLLNHFIVWNYFPEATQLHQAWFDDLVISTAPIGLRDMPVPPPADGGGGGTGDGGGGGGGDGGGGAGTGDDGGGCGCRAGGSGATPGAGLLGLLLAGAACWRSRRRPNVDARDEVDG